MACIDEKQIAHQFAEFYCNLMDKHRGCIASYLAEDAVLDWFGRTVNGRDAVANFINVQIPEMLHEFTSVEPTGPIQHRKKCFGEGVFMTVPGSEGYTMQGLEDLATPFGIQEVGQGDADATIGMRFQKLKLDDMEDSANCSEERRKSWEYKFTTPVNKEIGATDIMNSNLGGGGGQGDGFVTPVGNTIATCANRYLEARGCIQFERTKQSRVAPKNMKLVSDTMKWERRCKLKIAYSTESIVNHDHTADLARGFLIWLIVYQDNTKCRRNLIGAFEQQ